jgi:hypothetical protein
VICYNVLHCSQKAASALVLECKVYIEVIYWMIHPTSKSQPAASQQQQQQSAGALLQFRSHLPLIFLSKIDGLGNVVHVLRFNDRLLPMKPKIIKKTILEIWSKLMTMPWFTKGLNQKNISIPFSIHLRSLLTPKEKRVLLNSII